MEEADLIIGAANPQDEMGRISRAWEKLARHISFQLLQYEEGHRNLLAKTEFLAGVCGAYSLGSLGDAIFREVPPTDPSFEAIMGAFPIALAFAWSSSSIHANYNKLFEGLENIYKYLKYVLDDSRDLNNEERFEWIKDLFHIIVANGEYAPLGEFFELIREKESGQISLDTFLRETRKLLNDFEFGKVAVAMRDIIGDNHEQDSARKANELKELYCNFVPGIAFTDSFTRTHIGPMGLLFRQLTLEEMTPANYLGAMKTLLSDPSEFELSDDETEVEQLANATQCGMPKKACLLGKLGLDYGDHATTIAQAYVQPLNVFEGLSPRLKRILVFIIFAVSGVATWGDFRPCLAGTWYVGRDAQARQQTNKVDFWVIFAMLIGGFSSVAATWSNFSGLVDSIIGATDADKTYMWNSTTLPGNIVGFTMGGLAGGSYLLCQAAVNIFFSTGKRSQDLREVQLNAKGKIARNTTTALSLLARAEIYRSEIFEPVDQKLDAYLPRYAKVMLYLLTLTLLYLIVVPEVRGDYESIGRLLGRFRCFQAPASRRRIDNHRAPINDDRGGDDDADHLLALGSRVPMSTRSFLRNGGGE